MLDNKGFDLWANGYDKSVQLSEKNNEYPFAGYKDLLNAIYREVRSGDKSEVLDLGFGTGILTEKLYKDDYKISGIDFSENMINIAKEKMPEALFIQCDFAKEIPEAIKNKKYDAIISTYAIHHLDDGQKINFIKNLVEFLNEDGIILIGDVSFETRKLLDECRSKYEYFWDDDEYYFVFDELKSGLSDLRFEWKKISHCAGILSIKE